MQRLNRGSRVVHSIGQVRSYAFIEIVLPPYARLLRFGIDGVVTNFGRRCVGHPGPALGSYMGTENHL